MIKLLRGGRDRSVSSHLDPCVQGFDTIGGVLPPLVAGYACLFAGQGGGRYDDGIPPSSTNIENAFTASAFIAVDAWLQRAYANYD